MAKIFLMKVNNCIYLKFVVRASEVTTSHNSDWINMILTTMTLLKEMCDKINLYQQILDCDRMFSNWNELLW
jgi:hypothetical protein